MVPSGTTDIDGISPISSISDGGGKRLDPSVGDCKAAIK